MNESFKCEEKYGNYLVTKAVAIQELRCTLIELVHQPTGAEIMHIANDDPENLFCVGLRTWPTSSNGVAHILEHTVLCGSKNFPLKDPFFAMCRRSLNTYLNAMTGADFTCYPAASQVPADLYNLMEVYLDAVFHPLLRKNSFLQEGHRLEFSNPENSDSSLENKGVVFNEMKGAMSTPNARIIELLNASLFPDMTYQHNSGGNPKTIPNLTYEELIHFHQTFYHPSRSLFFFYGNFPLEKHLDFLEDKLLQSTSRLPRLDPLPKQKRFNTPKRVEGRYPIGPDSGPGDQTIIAFGWLTCHILEQLELLALCLIDSILLDTDASPLKKALLKSGYCKQVETYLDTDTSEIPFAIFLKGCRSENVDTLEKVIKDTLEEIVNKGIDTELIEHALHQMELYRREITGDGAPFGVSLFFRAGLLKLHGGDAEDSLIIDTLFSQLRENLKNTPNYFTSLIKKHLIDNPHFVRVTMHADAALSEEENLKEKDNLASIKKSLNQKQREQIVKSAQELEEFQNNNDQEDFNLLPKISVDDIPLTPPDYSLVQENVSEFKLFYHDTFTNGILYAELVYPIETLKKEDYPFITLFSSLLPQVGCGGRSYSEMLEYTQAHTGGISVSIAINRSLDDPKNCSPAIHLRGKALDHKSDKLFSLFFDMIHSADFSDHERLKELIKKAYTSLQNGMNQHAISYAMNLSASHLDAPSAMQNLWSGLDHYWTIKNIVENLDTEIEKLAKTCQRLHQQLLNLGKPHLVLTTSKKMVQKLKKHDFYGLTKVKPRPFNGWTCTIDSQKVESQGRIISSPVAFTAKTFRTVPFTHPAAPALRVIGNLLDHLVLHKKIREEGGAYGSGASNNATNGYFTFYSYRDPNLSLTLAAFEESIQQVASGNFSIEELEEAKLETIQSMDNPISPGSRGHVAYIWSKEGKTLERRQHFRNHILKLTKEEAITVTKELLVPANQKGVVVTFSGKELLDRENQQLKVAGLSPLKIKSITAL